MEIFQYVPFNSFIDQNFWYKLSSIKIDVDRLNDGPRKIYGFYTNLNAKKCLLEVDCTSFNEHFQTAKNCFVAHGTLLNKNTIEEFKSCDKSQIIKEWGLKISKTFTDGSVLDDPSLLSNFLILSFADLKCHQFYYWFCFPSSIDPIVQTTTKNDLKTVAERFSSEKIEKLNGIYFEDITESKFRQFFLIEENETDLQYKSLKDRIDCSNPNSNFCDQKLLGSTYFCYSDPSEFENPGWNLRSYITFLYKTCPNLRSIPIKVISIRVKNLKCLKSSLVYEVVLPAADPQSEESIKWIGWEPNDHGKLLPRMVDLGSIMDPKCLAENSVNLNLKLMKWRLLPELDLDIVARTKCLLLGAGTLGCGVARTLLSWGVNTLTFVDAGHVSFSNPVRQNLYTHADAIARKRKIDAAQERIHLIHPGTTVNGKYMVIPMPGHPVGESTLKGALASVNTLNELIESHDVVFLLTDSRESRWLPTLLGAVHDKIVINAALGFDSYVVMRHGSRRSNVENVKFEEIDGLKCIKGNHLGCYFCNDITAPGDSQKDRTLDQQCTVTRPSVSNIASSIAVELMVSLLQHHNGNLAPAYIAAGGNLRMNNLIPEGLLGIIPHSIRGMLCNFEQIIPATENFSQCIACSETVRNEYMARGNDFIVDVLNSTKYLEDLTGISDLEPMENDIIELDDNDDFELSD